MLKFTLLHYCIYIIFLSHQGIYKEHTFVLEHHGNNILFNTWRFTSVSLTQMSVWQTSNLDDSLVNDIHETKQKCQNITLGSNRLCQIPHLLTAQIYYIASFREYLKIAKSYLDYLTIFFKQMLMKWQNLVHFCKSNI